jgi:hypothetical protein
MERDLTVAATVAATARAGCVGTKLWHDPLCYDIYSPFSDNYTESQQEEIAYESLLR